MREEKRTEERVVTSTRTIYIADDGKEFESKKNCMDYELDVKKEKLREAISKFEIPEYDGYLPMTNSEEWRDCDVSWYNINNLNEYNMIYDFYAVESEPYFRKPKSYPTLMCVVDYGDFADVYYMKEIIDKAKKFFKDFGFDVTISKGE